MQIDETQIRQILREKGISYKYLAEYLGVSYPTITRRLKDNAFTYEQLVKIGQLIGAELGYVDKKTRKAIFILDSITPEQAKAVSEEERERFQSRLKQTMKEKGVRAIALAKEVGISRQSMSKYLQGERTPKAETIKAMAKVLEVSPEWLVGVG